MFLHLQNAIRVTLYIIRRAFISLSSKKKTMYTKMSSVHGSSVLTVKDNSFSSVLLFRFKDGAYLFKDIFTPVYDYAGNVDLNKFYQNTTRKLGLTTHFPNIIHE